jgi:hypothetical protein
MTGISATVPSRSFSWAMSLLAAVMVAVTTRG